MIAEIRACVSFLRHYQFNPQQSTKSGMVGGGSGKKPRRRYVQASGDLIRPCVVKALDMP
jgi:hypothetical protein